MPPKSKKAPSDNRQKATEDEVEDPLQAVILADPFETRFNPLTLEHPRCLLPLANVPLIEYTFEFLANAGVEEVFVYCGNHTDEVERYIQESKWYATSSPFSKVELIRSTSYTIGDAMRDLDQRGFLVGDFIVVYGDVVSNLPLEGALAAHRARRAKDKNAIMTMVLREAGTTHRTKAQGTKPVFVIDPSKDRCLHFEQINSKDQLAADEGKHHVSIAPDLLAENQEIDVRQDLIDCGIDICTPDVLALWSDNFDFQAPRRGFLHSVLKDYELNGKTIHTHIVNNHYAARVRNLHAYDAVSRDIVSRWAYPLCPDTNLLRSQSYRFQKGNIYKEDPVILARSCVVHRDSVIGKDTSIGDGSIISNSIIGRMCNIGRNVTIDGAYIWDNATIGDGTVIRQAIVANEASIGRKCEIEPGALISYSVRIADGMTIRGTSKITRAKRKRAEGEETDRADPDFSVVGERGDGIEFVEEDADETDEVIEGLVPLKSIYNMESLSLSAESISTLNSESDMTDESMLHRDRSTSFVSNASDASSHHAANFDHEAVDSLLDSLRKGDDSANMQLELNSLRLSTNASEHQVRKSVVTAFVRRISESVQSGVTPKQATEEILSPHQNLLSRTMFDKDVSGKVDQVDFMLALQADLCHRTDGDSILLFACSKLYAMDVVEADGFLQWWADVKSSDEEAMKSVRGKTKQFIDFLDESDDESEEESSEEEEEESDEE
ncbi:translation initiation factor-like protein eif-2b epsilon subunit [Saccharata proteae CBS 121410]|uniref:Mannose-1-phosphate guanyltransferase n=1 Tax=Saccharata proteae CBS 121410 TaxID=1314787 RepID=A0A9P4HXQ1_9PEZI|nr:translation initiation factor-like protein eif-2b epsilon subunit [Saccharata proteae CBS 121410]